MTENVILAQEIIGDINKRNNLHIVVVKSDMTKAYDRVYWKYCVQVLRRFTFSERIIDIRVSLISNNWYSVLMIGKAFGLFQSCKVLKEGDPFSQTLSIIATEVLTRILNFSFEHCDFKGFGMRKWRPQINHL